LIINVLRSKWVALLFYKKNIMRNNISIMASITPIMYQD
jgi:hypothetical protein